MAHHERENEMTKTLNEKLLDAEHRSANFLALANQAAEAGWHEKAERLYAKSQYWLDRYNLLAGNS